MAPEAAHTVPEVLLCPGKAAIQQVASRESIRGASQLIRVTYAQTGQAVKGSSPAKAQLYLLEIKLLRLAEGAWGFLWWKATGRRFRADKKKNFSSQHVIQLGKGLSLAAVMAPGVGGFEEGLDTLAAENAGLALKNCRQPQWRGTPGQRRGSLT